MKMVIVGGGAFGTAIACTLASRSANKVMILVRSQVLSDSINESRRNTKYLADFKLPKAVKATTNYQVLGEAEIIFLALPAHQVVAFVTEHQIKFSPEAIIINLAK